MNPKSRAHEPRAWWTLLCLLTTVALAGWLFFGKQSAHAAPSTEASRTELPARLALATAEAGGSGAPASAPLDSEELGDGQRAAGGADALALGANAHHAPFAATASSVPPNEPDADGVIADPFATAVLGPEGGVPYHTEGEFRSPFANPTRKPVAVKVGFLLTAINDYDIKAGTFEADFFVSFTSDKPMPEMDPTFSNGRADDVQVLADRPTFKLYRFMGKFQARADLRDYPFDTQELVIELEDDSNGLDQLRLRADMDHTFLDSGFLVPGWDVTYLRGRVLNHFYPDRFENDDLYYSRYQFVLGVRRFANSAVFTVFVPAIVIVLISLSGLWIGRDKVDVRSNATTPMLAAAVLFHFALMQELPATAYLSRADKLMMATYVCLGLHMLITWLWFIFDERHTDRIFYIGKYGGAPLTVLIMLGGIFL